MKTKLLAVLLMVFSIQSCGPFFREQQLHIALLNEHYAEQILYGDNSGVIMRSEVHFEQSAGEMPVGLDLYDDGQILGTAESIGLHLFEVKIYTIGSDDDGDEEINIEDIKKFQLFVTEPSTNDACPSPDDLDETQTHLCLGAGFLDSLAEGESFTLDVNYFVDFAKASDYQINNLVFTIFYDSDHFELDGNDLSDNILREAATDVDATVSYVSEPGELKITLTSSDEESFRFSGRLIDLPLYAKSNIEPNSFPFDLRIDDIESDNPEIQLPETVAVDGTVVVD